jgi:hypothetical protein
MRQSWRAASRWVQATDPAALRRAHGARAVGTVLCTGTSLWLIVESFRESALLAVVLFGVAVCFATALVIADPGRRDRQVSMALGAGVWCGSVMVVAFVDSDSFAGAIVLLGLIFCSFAFRRWGLRSGELAMLATMGWYFGGSYGASTDQLGWYVLAVVVAVGWFAVWQFLILPYRPERSLEQAVAAFGRRAGELVVLVDRALWSARSGDTGPHDLREALRQVERTRKVIESQFPGVLAPRGWTASRLRGLQLELFEAERGLGQMVRAIESDGVDELPADVAESLSGLLRSLAGWLVARPSDPATRFEEDAAAFRVRVVAMAGDLDETQVMSESARWIGVAVRMSRGCAGVAAAIEEIRRLRVESVIAASEGRPTSRDRPRPTAQPLGPGPRLRVHPTTALGVQAVVATGLAMLVAVALGMQHANWVFWSAFVVIAGSAGESVRRVFYRVLGTLVGTTVGALVVVTLPDEFAVVLTVVTLAVFFAVFFAPVSYVAMVFWMSLGSVVVFARLGEKTSDLVVQRPVTAALGAGIAAVVALVVVPVRVTSRYREHLAALLDAVAVAVERWVEVAVDRTARASADDATGAVSVMYEPIERLLPSLSFESNPLVQARSSLSGQSTHLAALLAALDQVAEAALDESERPIGDSPVVLAARDRVVAGLGATADVLRGDQGTVVSTMEDVVGGASASAAELQHRRELLWALIDVHGAVVQLARDFDVPTETHTERRERVARNMGG